MRDVTEAHAMSITEEAHGLGQALLDRRQRFIGARRGDATGFSEERIFQCDITAAPFGNLQTRRQLGVRLVERMGEEPGKERCAARTFHELRRAREQPQDDAQQRRVGNRASRDMHQQFRATHHRRALQPGFGGVGAHFIEPMRVPEFLHEQRVKILPCDLLEERIETTDERGVGEAGRGRTVFERALAEGVIRLQPVLRKLADELDHLRRGTRREILLTIALQSLARLQDHLRRQRRFRRQVSEEVVRQNHFVADWTPAESGCSRRCTACRQGRPTSESISRQASTA